MSAYTGITLPEERRSNETFKVTRSVVQLSLFLFLPSFRKVHTVSYAAFKGQDNNFWFWSKYNPHLHDSPCVQLEENDDKIEELDNRGSIGDQ